MSQSDLFGGDGEPRPFAAGAWLLPGFAEAEAGALWQAIQAVLAQAPQRHMQTPGGFRMSVALSNCGELGWVTDSSGYRYQNIDPDSGKPWPALPNAISSLASRAAEAAGYAGFQPDACLINRYEAGARMSLHQDRNERDFCQPIVSVSLGLPATFLFGGLTRSERTHRLLLQHGDVVVWGGPSRLAFHGVLPLAAGLHPLCGEYRFNLTLRKAG